MGKHRFTSFDRVANDFYRTPMAAVIPLLPHLPAATHYAEPCVGDGALVEHLATQGHVCDWSFDIVERGNFHEIGDATTSARPAQMFITNPPWKRPAMHAIIENLTSIAPTWLLFESEWVHTQQSIPFLPWLKKIVSVGRVKWHAETKSSGLENCAWHYFDQHAEGDCVFFGRLPKIKA